MLLCAALLLCALSAHAGVPWSKEVLERTRVHKELLWQRDPQQEVLLRAAIQHGQQQKSPTPYDRQQLERLFGGYRFLLPMRDMKRGITHRGTMSKLRALMHSLLMGDTSTRFKAGVLGGSPSTGHGASVLGLTDYFSLFSGWVTATFPNVNSTFRNGAIPATPSKYMALCLHSHIEPDANLVFIEYNLNDESSTNNQVAGNPAVMSMERLIRGVMELPGKPAVVLLQVPANGQAQSKDDRLLGDGVKPFYQTVEDVDGALCAYYNVPCISMRNALYHITGTGREGFKWHNLFVDVHPGDAGYKVLADMAVYLMQEATLDLLAEPWGPEDAEELGEPMPQPMYPGNVPPASTQCSVGLALRQIVQAASGFHLVNEGNAQASKWGYVATRPGAFLQLQLSTQLAASGGSHRNNSHAAGATNLTRHDVAVHLMHLKSYESMGQATVTCVHGCTCERQLVDAHHPDHSSTVFLHSFEMTRSPSCVVRVEVTEETKSGQHKFKVVGIAVGSAKDVGLSDIIAGVHGEFFLYHGAQDIISQRGPQN